MSTITMNAMNTSLSAARFGAKPSRGPSLATTKFLQARASLPEMPEMDSHVTAFVSVAARLAAAAVAPVVLTWLAVAG
jgi:hypothetical protein